MRAGPQRGRRPGDPEATKRAILEAARRRFAEAGYDGATIRAVAADAGVDPALVHYHFGSKEDLFAAAHDMPVRLDTLRSVLRDGPSDELGERVTRFYLEVLFAPGSSVVSLLGAGMTHDGARTMVRQFIEHAVLPMVGEELKVDRPRYRMALVGAHLIGILVVREVIGIEPLRSAELDDIVVSVAHTVQRYLTDELPGA